ncbi:MAG TPA: GNAT family N-acetyltransferase, partial [Acidimicrobiales bacterium]|nr:GNAT family N-acetyltransferase [Acidimicrobiales bacterium]
HVVVDDDEVAKGVEQDVGAAGWVVDTEVVMALSAPPDRGTDSTAVEELGEEETLELMRRWLLEERPATPAEGLEQVTEYNRREGRLWEERRFGVRDERGAAVAITKLRARHGVGWVEDVYTVPEARSRGYARMLVTHAADLARAAGYDLTFIVADDDDWPKTLYAKVGFRPVGWMRTFHRS